MIRENTDPLQLKDRRGRVTDALRDLWRGCSGWIVGGGPSLQQFDWRRLGERGQVSIGINNVGGMVPVSAWFAGDGPGRFHHGIWHDPKMIKFVPTWRCERKPANQLRKKGPAGFETLESGPLDMPNVFRVPLDTEFEAARFLVTKTASFGRSKNNSQELNAPGSLLFSIFPAIRLAYYLGLRRVYLLGVDFDMAPEQPYAFNQGRAGAAIESNQRSYQVASGWLSQLGPILEAAGMEIRNVNSASKLTCFPFVDWSEAIADAANGVPAEPFDLSGWYESTKIPAVSESTPKPAPSRSVRAVLPVVEGCEHRTAFRGWAKHQFSRGLAPVFGCQLHGECTLDRIDREKSRRVCSSCSDRKPSDLVPVLPQMESAAPEPSVDWKAVYDDLYRSEYGSRSYGRTTHGRKAVPRIIEMRPDSLIDVGCGWNSLKPLIMASLSIRIVGTDLSCPGADVLCPASRLPFLDGEFDLLTSFEVLEHVPESDVMSTLREMARVSRRFIFSIATKPSRITWQGLNLHPTVQPREWWVQKIESAGGRNVAFSDGYLSGEWKKPFACSGRGPTIIDGSAAKSVVSEICGEKGTVLPVFQCLIHQAEATERPFRKGGRDLACRGCRDLVRISPPASPA